jgi:hypothetical protein
MNKRASKWLKYGFMKKSGRIAAHLPETKLFSRIAFLQMLDKYGQIIVKPVLGSRGARVKMITALGRDVYEFHLENHKTVIRGKDAIYEHVKRHVQESGRRHLVQRRIKLATVRRRPFDMRVVVQRRTASGRWRVTGKLAKIAGEGYIVTNITRSGGEVMRLTEAIRRSSLGGRPAGTLTREVKRVALLSAQRLGKLYRGHRIFGLDMGFDKRGKVWVIEANLRPMMSHFKKLGDPKMYRRIRSYQ